ncbi:hypothetical protein NIES4073_79340 [Kalymmatonema gypsitolerans NIES-4073]|nr:hypothetical protein NIES4073_79340 [Scytonema sp. NIES-4073]
MNHLTGNHLTGKVGIAKIRLIYGMLVPAEPVRACYMVDIAGDAWTLGRLDWVKSLFVSRFYHLLMS